MALQLIEDEVQVPPPPPPPDRRYVRPTFINHTGQIVQVLWYRRSDPDHLFLARVIAPDNTVTVSHYQNMAVGTPLIFKWTSANMTPMDQGHYVDHDSNEIPIGVATHIQWKHGALKLDYLMKSLIKVGADNEKLYPNLAPIIDLFQDIDIPEVTEHEKEEAGIPSVLTNPT